MFKNYKKRVLKYALKAYERGLVTGTGGNFSIRTTCGKIIITPSGYDYTEITEEDIMVIDLEGNVIEGRHKPSSEWPMHCEIYNSMPGVGGISHTHSPYATAIAVLGEEIPLILVETALILMGEVRTAPIAIPGSKELGVVAVEALGGRGVCLLQNHGTVSVGADLKQAFLRSEHIEEAAKIYHISRAAGNPEPLSGGVVREILSRKRRAEMEARAKAEAEGDENGENDEDEQG